MKLKFYPPKKGILAIFASCWLTVGYAQYCTIGLTDNVEPITRVQFATINNISDSTLNGSPVLEDFTAISTALVPGNTYPITVWGNTFGTYTNYIRVYIDWNGNFDFSDMGESFNIGTIYNCTNCSVSGSITVPATVPVASTRMRIVKRFNNYGTSCQTMSWGQVEDYTLIFTTTPCSGVPNGGTATASATTVCAGTSVSFSVTGGAGGSGITFQWQNSVDGGITWNNISGAVNAGYTAPVNTAASFRRRVVCATGPDTSYSSPVSVAMTSFLSCYCTASATSTSFEKITSVQFGPLSNPSTSSAGYEDFTGLAPQTFYVGSTYPLTVTAAPVYTTDQVFAWIDYNRNGLFTDPGEMVFTSAVSAGPYTSNITIPGNAQAGITRMRIRLQDTDPSITGIITNNTPCGVTSFGQVEDYYINIFPSATNEAGIVAITKPEVAACSLGQQIWVKLQNLGTNPLTSATFTVKVNGLSIPAGPWTGNVPPQSTMEVQVPVSYSLADADSIIVEVSLPNGQVEDPAYAFNNISARRVYAGLSGTKTVYGTGPDFINMATALQALQLRGVCDTVRFKLASGNYATQHVFVPYPGAGAGRLAVFESASGNAGDVVFSYAATGTGNNYIFRFDGGDGYAVRNLTGKATGATGFSTVVDILNGADDLTFEGNVFIGDTAVAYNGSDFNGIVVASVGGTADQRTTLRNNRIVGGNRGLNLGGSASVYEAGHIVEGNTIEKYAYIGGIFGSISGLTVKGNTFRPRTNLAQETNALYIVGSIDGADIRGNNIRSYRIGTSIFLSNVKGGAKDVLVANNFLFQGDSLATGLSRGILVQDAGTAGVVLANNSISMRSNNPGSGAITVIDGSQIRLLNNNVGAFRNGPAARIEKTYSVSESDHNNIFGTNLANVLGTVYTTLPGLQAGTGRDAHSVSVNPGFNGTDLHTCAPALNAAALPLPYITVDYDGDLRSATPDIGADEFVGDNGGLLEASTFLKCPSEQATIGNTPLAGVAYTWTPAGNGTASQITVTAAGVYTVTATSACGSFSATAAVINKPLPTASFTSTTVGLTGIFTNTSAQGTAYLWDFGDGHTSAEFSPSHVYGSAGTYSVKLTVVNECGTATFGPQTVNVINAGVSETSADMELTLFPNPTSGQYTLTVGHAGNEAFMVSVIDVTGKVLSVKNLPAGINQVTLDATSYASGIYSVKVGNATFSKVVRLIRK